MLNDFSNVLFFVTVPFGRFLPYVIMHPPDLACLLEAAITMCFFPAVSAHGHTGSRSLSRLVSPSILSRVILTHPHERAGPPTPTLGPGAPRVVRTQPARPARPRPTTTPLALSLVRPPGPAPSRPRMSSPCLFHRL